MKFNELTDKDKAYIKEVYNSKDGSWEQRAIKLSEEYGVSERTMRRWCAEKLSLKNKDTEEPEQYKLAKKKKINKKNDKFIITWAQNNTPVHKQFLTNIEAYAEHIGADIHVIAGRYKNPTSVFTDSDEDFWVDDVLDYLDAGRHNLHKYLSIMSDVKIQPTAINPMSGLHGMSGVNSCIFGSPKVQMEMIPVLEGNKPKMMLTTGSVTVSNYTDSKSGKKGEFHHVYGFVVIEIKDNETFYVRQVTADDKTGEFNDLYYNVNHGVITENDNIEAIVLGDLHYGQHDQDVLDVTYDMMEQITPKHVILHDVFNGSSINHHESKDPFLQYGKDVHNLNNLKNEVDEMLVGLKAFEKYDNVVIVRSNHDDFLDRWLKNEDWKKQPSIKNSMEYMRYSSILLNQYSKDPYNVKGVIPELINEVYPKYKTLGRSDSYKVKNWELGLHGDVGLNGSRGNINQFRKLNTKIIVGHYHCLPAEYLVQTKNKGWKEIRAIKVGDEILSFDPNTGRNVWNVVDEFIESEYNGIMLQISGNGFEQTFTDKHMLMMTDGSYIPATEAICTRSSSELPLSALPENTYGISVPENVIRQIVAIAADGYQSKYSIRFKLKKERKIKRLKELFGDSLTGCNVNDDGIFTASISTRSELYANLLKYKYNLKNIKNISVEVLDWDDKSLECLISELKYWDGTFDPKGNSNQYSTTNKMESNVISSALNRLGYSHRVLNRVYDNINHKDCNIITWCSDRNFIRNSGKMNHNIRFNGWNFNSYNTNSNTKVYCVSVKNKCFWIKSAKTGHVSLTGNSPGRKDGSLSVGTSTKLRMGYNVGASSWLHSHVIIHKDGRAQHINFIKDKNNEINYTTFKKQNYE